MWTICPECQGQGKKSQRLTKKVRLQYQKALDQFEKNNSEGTAPIRPKAHKVICQNCSGSGLISSEILAVPNQETYPHVAIIGAGIGGPCPTRRPRPAHDRPP